MKRIIYSIFVLAIASTMFSSCIKENLEIANQKSDWQLELSNIYSDGRMLIFKYVQDYELLVNDPSEELVVEFLDYISNMEHTTQADYLSTLNQEELDSIVYDEYLSKILNEDCILQIGEHLYKVNTATEKVYVMHSSEIEHYSHLVDEDTVNEIIREFSTGDDVIYIVEGIDSLEKSCGGIGGGLYFAYGTGYEIGKIVGYIGGHAIKLNPWVRMFCGGVYYRLSANFKVTSTHPYLKENGINIQIQVKGWQGGWYKRRPCCSTCIGSLSANQIIINADQNTMDGSYNFYSGSRNLNGYYFFIRGRNATASSPYNDWTDYAGRNINSPY